MSFKQIKGLGGTRSNSVEIEKTIFEPPASVMKFHELIDSQVSEVETELMERSKGARILQ